jgi:putative hydrolases of HD superfamily
MEPHAKTTADRLEKQIQFLLEIDKLKSILRRTYVIHEDRSENTAEHSWHLAITAMILSEYANENIDVAHVIKMVLIHDIVEIDAGDTYLYDAAGALDKAERERVAADRLFGLLPADQGKEFRDLWDEFERRETIESRFAAALDRFIPQLHNYHTQGRSWKEHGITADRVLDRNSCIADGSCTLWEWAEALLNDAVEKGFLRR